LKIVLIEDDSIMASSVRLQLKVLLKNDYELTTFKRLEKAMSYIENNDCDIVISDMNVMDSRAQETIDRLTSNSNNFKLIIISGCFEQLEVNKSDEDNYQFIPKDMDLNESISSAIQSVYG